MSPGGPEPSLMAKITVSRIQGRLALPKPSKPVKVSVPRFLCPKVRLRELTF